MVAEGDTIAYRYTMTMKHTGQSPTLPIPPTGKEVTLKGCIVVHVRDGKIVKEFDERGRLVDNVLPCPGYRNQAAKK
jgi:predicted ester cyclase